MDQNNAGLVKHYLASQKQVEEEKRNATLTLRKLKDSIYHSADMSRQRVEEAHLTCQIYKGEVFCLQ